MLYLVCCWADSLIGKAAVLKTAVAVKSLESSSLSLPANLYMPVVLMAKTAVSKTVNSRFES